MKYNPYMPIPGRTLPSTNPPEDEVNAVALLAGEPRPVRCSLCLGAGSYKRLYGWSRCPQCEGLGWDSITGNMRQWVLENRVP